jgi:hypothetical protein
MEFCGAGTWSLDCVWGRLKAREGGRNVWWPDDALAGQGRRPYCSPGNNLPPGSRVDLLSLTMCTECRDLVKLPCNYLNCMEGFLDCRRLGAVLFSSLQIGLELDRVLLCPLPF